MLGILYITTCCIKQAPRPLDNKLIMISLRWGGQERVTTSQHAPATPSKTLVKSSSGTWLELTTRISSSGKTSSCTHNNDTTNIQVYVV